MTASTPIWRIRNAARVGPSAAGRSLAGEAVTIDERRARGPRVVIVGELDPLAEARMGGTPDRVQEPGARNVEVLLLELHESHGGRVIVAGELEPEPIGLVL